MNASSFFSTQMTVMYQTLIFMLVKKKAICIDEFALHKEAS